jgi:hypothetical protein
MWHRIVGDSMDRVALNCRGGIGLLGMVWGGIGL